MLLPHLPENIVLLITDTLPSPAFFLLNNALVAQLRDKKRATVLSISEDLARWKAVAAKSNVDLPQSLDSHNLTFISVPSILNPSFHSTPSSASTSQPSLRPLYDAVVNSLNNSSITTPGAHEAGTESDSSHHLVILDDITTLDWIGFSVLDIARFLRAIVALCKNVKATLIIRHHITTSDEHDLFRRLLQLSTYHLEVRALASGRSGAISGEVALHPGPSTPPGSIKPYPRSSALQYRLTDTGAIFFERGTGAAAL